MFLPRMTVALVVQKLSADKFEAYKHASDMSADTRVIVVYNEHLVFPARWTDSETAAFTSRKKKKKVILDIR